MTNAGQKLYDQVNNSIDQRDVWTDKLFNDAWLQQEILKYEWSFHPSKPRYWSNLNEFIKLY